MSEKYIGMKIGELLITGLDRKIKLKTGGFRYFMTYLCSCGKESSTCTSNIINAITHQSRISCGHIKNRGASHAAWTTYLQQYRDGAKKRNIQFQLTREEFILLASQNCHYCSAEPRSWDKYKEKRLRDYKSKGRPKSDPSEYLSNCEIFMNGIDRKTPTLGYTVENSITACSRCNMCKQSLSYEEFKDWIKKVHTHLNLLTQP